MPTGTLFLSKMQEAVANWWPAGPFNYECVIPNAEDVEAFGRCLDTATPASPVPPASSAATSTPSTPAAAAQPVPPAAEVTILMSPCTSVMCFLQKRESRH